MNAGADHQNVAIAAGPYRRCASGRTPGSSRTGTSCVIRGSVLFFSGLALAAIRRRTRCRRRRSPRAAGAPFHRQRAGSSGEKSRVSRQTSGTAAEKCAIEARSGRPSAIWQADRPMRALVAQPDRASDFESEGREFESLRARQGKAGQTIKKPNKTGDICNPEGKSLYGPGHKPGHKPGHVTLTDG